MSHASSPSTSILGLHHVTAIARDPQQNVDFYAGILGLRLVKKTINFDDPSTYHLYYGDGVGSPGSLITFFPWAGARLGHSGVGQTSATSFAVPEGSLPFWHDRLVAAGIAVTESIQFGQGVLSFRDFDGLHLEIVAAAEADDVRVPWHGSDVPVERAIRGFDGVTLLSAASDDTASLLVDVMGFRRVGRDGARIRYEVGAGGSGARVDLWTPAAPERARGGAGTVHHVAFRNADDASQEEWRQHLTRNLMAPTEVKDRQYFHSIYYREPGGVLFELATDPPGFSLDESLDSLGQELRLPPWLEPARSKIEASLTPLSPPTFSGGAEPAHAQAAVEAGDATTDFANGETP